MNIETQLKAAAFDRLLQHLQARTDVQNIELMNLADFCRNCLANWLQDAAQAAALPLDKAAAREYVYGMPFEQWKAQFQREATPEQLAKFAQLSHAKHEHKPD